MCIEYGRYAQKVRFPAGVSFVSSLSTTYVLWRTVPGMSSSCVGPHVGWTRTTASLPTFGASSARVKSS